ncbi:MAG: methyltransferase domain-containing protein [Opitutus sp.]
MPALTAPPPPRTEIELPSVSFFGRSLDEYVRFFSLNIDELRGRPVLDVAAGPSSFTAEACRRGIDAVAVDPLYGSSVDSLVTHIQLDYARMFTQMRAKPRLFKVGPLVENREVALPRQTGRRCSAVPYYFTSIDAAEAERRAAAQRFLSDYESHFVHSRYVGASLPRLPFQDGAFDLVLCAHLLFTYARTFDFDWHVAACRELVRVSASEVRIHPVCGADGRRYPELDRLRRELMTGGIRTAVVDVDYEFFAGSDSMLVLNPASE